MAGIWGKGEQALAGDPPGELEVVDGIPSSTLSTHFLGRLVFAEADINCVAQEVVRSPCQVGDLGDELRLHPMNARKNQRRAETSLAWGQYVEGWRIPGERVETASQIGEHFVGHPRAHPAGVEEFSVVGVVAEQQCPKIRPRSFRVRPAHDDEFLAVERLGFTPETAVSRSVGRVNRLRDDAFKTELAGVLRGGPPERASISKPWRGTAV
jgi:hypothetical protein